MSGTRTLGTIGLAVVLGALAGGLAGSLTGSGPAADDGKLRKEIAHLETALEESGRDLTRAQREIVHLKDRMSDTEIGLADVREKVPTAEQLAAVAAAEARMAAGPGGVTSHASGDAPPAIRMLGGPTSGKAIMLGDGPLGVELPVEMKKRLDTIRKAHALRSLDEDARWEKAQAELGLSYNQVADLKAAIEERAEALAGARTTIESTTEGGATMVRAIMDHQQMQAARKVYTERVAGVLNAEQRDAWKSDGYDQAFGGGGGTATFAFTTGVHVGTPKDDEKEK